METRKAYQDTHVTIDLDDAIFKDFLDSQKPRTRKTYECFVRKLVEYAHLSGQQLLDQQEQWNRKILIFQQYLKSQSYSDSYAVTCCAMVRAFFDFYDKPLRLNRNARLKLRERTLKGEPYLFQQSEIALMARNSSQKESYVLLVGCSVGLRSEDFCNFTYGQFRSIDLNGEAPISLGRIFTAKEKTEAYPHLSTDAIPIIKAILDSHKDAPDEELVFKERPQQLTVILQNLAKKCGIDPHGKHISFHAFRRYLYTRLSQVGSEQFAKAIIGKKIPQSDKVYLDMNSLRDIYVKAMPNIVTSNGNGQVKKDLAETKSTVEQLVKLLAEKDKTIAELKTQLAQNNNTMSKLLSLPTIAKELRNQKEKVPID